MNILIIEDEQRTALDLAGILQEIMPLANIAAMLESVEESVRFLESGNEPDLIFMDIQLADGLSFEIFNLTKVSAPVIFCTAFDEYALKAFEVNSIDYVLKPFDRESVERALAKMDAMKAALGSNSAPEIFNQMIADLKPAYKTSLLVGLRDKLLPIDVHDIAFFYIDHEITFLHTFEGKRFILNKTLDELEKSLDPEQFYRANRQFLINFKAVNEVEPLFARKLLLKLNAHTKEPVIISKAKAAKFMQWLEQR